MAAVVLVVGVVVAVGAGSGDTGDGDDTGGDSPAAGTSGEDVRTVQPGAPGEETRELTDEEAAAVDAPEHGAADTAFMQDMIVHHRQALAMAALVDDRTRRDDLPRLAERITVAQEAEIDLMEAWLADRGEEAPDEEAGTHEGDDAADHQDHDAMPGMATAAQLDRLEAAEGTAFDRLFLDLMIAHHQGAVTMVEELYAAGGGIEPAADQVARDAEADQNIEIRRMQELRDSL